MIHLDSQQRNYPLIHRQSRPEWLWPSVVTIHPTDACNHNCEWCWFARSPSRIEMLSVLDLVDFLVSRGAKEIVVSGGGEPLLHPQIARLFDYLRSNEQLRRRLYTNGSTLDRHLSRVSKAFDYIRVSIDAGDPDLYSKLHGTLSEDYYRTLSALSDIGQRNPNVSTGVSMILTQDNISSCSQLYEDCQRFGIGFLFLKAMVSGLSREALPALPIQASASACKVLIRQDPRYYGDTSNISPPPIAVVAGNLVIAPEGGVYPCCHLNETQHRISSATAYSLRTNVGNPRHIRILRDYAKTPHPCRVHDTWAIWNSEKDCPPSEI